MAELPYIYDVFLSHTSSDKASVEFLAHRLIEEGLKPFLDKWHLIPGEPWQEKLEEALDQSRTCAVFLGPSGLGPWENEEMRNALDQRVRDKSFRVIPILLPDTNLKDRTTLPRFLARLTWVDFRNRLDDDNAFNILLAGILGKSPGPTTIHGKDKVQNILDQHRMWIESGGKDGRQADLSGSDLRRMDLSRSILSQSILSGADLTDADLSYSDLSQAALIDTLLNSANLRRANLFQADLTRTHLAGANLDGANLTQCRIEESYDIDQARNLDGAGVSGRLWLEARRHLEHFTGDVLPVKPIWRTRKYKFDPNLGFILMPFSNEPPYQHTNDVYQVHVKPTVERFGLNCIRADDIFGPSSIMEDVWSHILKASLIVADVTGRNPNVFYELGMAHTVGRPTIVIAQDENDVPFDIRAFRYLKYEISPLQLKEFEVQLEKTIATVLQQLPDK